MNMVHRQYEIYDSFVYMIVEFCLILAILHVFDFTRQLKAPL